MTEVSKIVRAAGRRAAVGFGILGAPICSTTFTFLHLPTRPTTSALWDVACSILMKTRFPSAL